MGTADMHHRPFGIPIDLGGRAGQPPVAGEQVVNLAGDLHSATRHENQIVRYAFEFGEHVGRQQDRYAVVGCCGEHGGHEVVPGDRVERCHRLIQHEQRRSPGQRQGERELCLLTAGQPASFSFQRDAQLGKPGLGRCLIKASVEVPAQVQHVFGREVLVQRSVLGDERDSVQGVWRARRSAAEDTDDTCGRRRQPGRQVQQSALPGPVGTDQRDDMPGGDRQVAVTKRPGTAVSLSQTRGPR